MINRKLLTRYMARSTKKYSDLTATLFKERIAMKSIEELIDDIIKYKDADVDWYKTAIISKFRELKQQVERLTECRDHWKLSYEELKKKTGTVQERIKEPIPANEDDYGEDFIQPPRYEDDEI